MRAGDHVPGVNAKTLGSSDVHVSPPDVCLGADYGLPLHPSASASSQGHVPLRDLAATEKQPHQGMCGGPKICSQQLQI